ncbi:unnamed protein product [Strongylus vulgaris]|uniref:Uncharacterized protein n=1 Tax=Strongylus vulgaris TaxID=40348 RepID=A0A3P7JMC2_STRVU|nr:unnamed protein product [Strongylus vulgaris]
MASFVVPLQVEYVSDVILTRQDETPTEFAPRPDSARESAANSGTGGVMNGESAALNIPRPKVCHFYNCHGKPFE